MLKILWLAPYSYEKARGEKECNSTHPAPWMTELANELSTRVELTIANWSKKVNRIEVFDKDGIQFVFIPGPRLRYDRLSLCRLRIQRLHSCLKNSCLTFDGVHVHGTEHQYEQVAQRLGIPFVVSIQGIINLYRPFYPFRSLEVYASWLLNSIYEHQGIKRSHHFFCRTNMDKGYVLKLNPSAKIFYNWEIIRNEFFANNFNRNSKYLLFMGGTQHFKGFRETIRAMSILKKRGLGLKLRIIGFGEKGELERFLEAENISLSALDVEFLGYQNAQGLSNLFRDSFCMVHPSYMDNSPNSICEAQVSGLPVIASEVGGVSSLIEDGLTGLFVKRYDHLGIADQICRLVYDKGLYNSISTTSRSVSRLRHSRKIIVSNTLEAYEAICH